MTDRHVAEAVSGGARSLAGVCRATGAAQDCGGCVCSLKRLVCEHEQARGSMLANAVPALSGVDVAAG